MATQAIIEQFLYAKMHPHLKKSINQADLEIGTHEQMSHLERELELNGLEAPVELQINTETQQATQQNSQQLRPTCHHCKKTSRYRKQWCRQLKREKDQARNNTNSVDNSNNNNDSGQTNPNSNNKVSKNTNANNTNNQKTEDLNVSTHLSRPVVKLFTPQRNVTLE